LGKRIREEILGIRDKSEILKRSEKDDLRKEGSVFCLDVYTIWM